MEDIYVEGVEPMMRLPNCIPSWKGKAKVTMDPNTENFAIATCLLPEQIPFEGPQLPRISLLKMEDWDLTNHTKFPHLVTKNICRSLIMKKQVLQHWRQWNGSAVLRNQDCSIYCWCHIITASPLIRYVCASSSCLCMMGAYG